VSAAENKTALREVALTMLNAGLSQDTVLHIISTVSNVVNPNDGSHLTPRQIDNVFKAIETCDWACAFGRGHQSTVTCDRRGPHGTNHYNRSQRLEWDEEHHFGRTHEYQGKVYRLAFSDEGWY
jgi:hypothetical protein